MLANLNIIEYTDSDNLEQEEIISKKMLSNTTIVATNLAGSGTDLLPSDEVGKNGGIYVILSFMPYN